MSKPIQCPNCGEEISGDYMSADNMRRMFFATLRDVHANLRDEFRDRWPNAEIMRKHVLIAIGYCDAMTVAVGSKAAAPAVANAFKMQNQYCIATVRGDVVTIFTARSMARRALPKKEFRDVVEKVFAYIAAQTGIDPSQSQEAA
jgi:hypothetical protein